MNRWEGKGAHPKLIPPILFCYSALRETVTSADLRPKGRGRPQRILLGVWPDEHIRGVIRAVVFRDSHQIKEEPPMSYQRMHVSSRCVVSYNFHALIILYLFIYEGILTCSWRRCANCTKEIFGIITTTTS